jgi:ribose transport system substrate-binding protein
MAKNKMAVGAMVATTVLGVAGIGLTGIPAASAASAPAVPAAGSGKGESLALIQGTDSDPFYITMACGAEAEAKRLGATISVQGPADFSASEQIPIVNSVTAKHPKAVLIAPTDVQALIPPMKQMKAAGIKLVQVDTSVNNTSLAVSSITSNNIEGGTLAATTLANLIGKTGSVVVINEQPGISTTDARAIGFAQGMKKFPNIKVLPIQYDQDSATTAASLVSSEIAAHPDLTGIFAINTITAEGVGTGLTQAGASGKKVKVVGFDASPQSVQQLQANVVQALIAQQPALEGKDGVDQAVLALNGKKNTKNIGTGLVAITQANLSKMGSYLYKSSC